MKLEFGTYNKVPIRSLWEKEHLQFTPWLKSNIEYLNDALNLKIEPLGIEQPAGSLSIDILGEDVSGAVIIENQFGKTDHDHLGKSLTYMAYQNAKTLIWICEETRPEHEKLIDWLNEKISDISFYLVKIEVFRIDDSRPFPKFIKICGPSNEAKIMRKYQEDLSDYEKSVVTFWDKFLAKLEVMMPDHKSSIPSRNPWLLRTAGKPGLAFAYYIFKDSAAIELYSDNQDGSINEKRFNWLKSNQVDIEKELEFGKDLMWDIKPERRSQKVRYPISGAGLDNEELWDDIQNKMILSMKKYIDTFQKYIDKMEI